MDNGQSQTRSKDLSVKETQVPKAVRTIKNVSVSTNQFQTNMKSDNRSRVLSTTIVQNQNQRQAAEFDANMGLEDVDLVGSEDSTPKPEEDVKIGAIEKDDVEKDKIENNSLLVKDGGEVYELRTSFESLSGGTHTFEYWCLDSKPLNDMFLGFESDLKNAKKELSAAREANDAAGIKKAEASIREITLKINKSENDPALREAYKSNEQKTAFTGYKITRKDAKGRATNLSGAADTIEIETRGLSGEHTLRIVMPGGETLQLGVDKDGNWNGEALFLTKFGAKVPHKFTGEEDDNFFTDNAKNFGNRRREGIFYNRHEDILAELGKMEEIKFNGVNILEKIKEKIKEEISPKLENETDKSKEVLKETDDSSTADFGVNSIQNSHRSQVSSKRIVFSASMPQQK